MALRIDRFPAIVAGSRGLRAFVYLGVNTLCETGPAMAKDTSRPVDAFQRYCAVLYQKVGSSDTYRRC